MNAGARALALEFGNAVAKDTTAQANGAVRPQNAFEMFPRLVGVGENGIGEVHDNFISYFWLGLGNLCAAG